VCLVSFLSFHLCLVLPNSVQAGENHVSLLSCSLSEQTIVSDGDGVSFLVF
jgi:hypothetical protein